MKVQSYTIRYLVQGDINVRDGDGALTATATGICGRIGESRTAIFTTVSGLLASLHSPVNILTLRDIECRSQ